MHVSAAALALLCLAACAGNAPTAPAPGVPPAPRPTGPSVLFFGNSLTEANDLPGRVRAIAAAGGLGVYTESVTQGNTSLADHWAAGRAQPAIASRRWSFVVLQQGPSTLPASRVDLLRSTETYAAAVNAVGGRTALLMVWPLPGQTTEAVASSYRAAAEATGSLLIPAGEEWVRAREADPTLVLTESDGYHPSVAGTEIAARTVVCTLWRAEVSPATCAR